MRKNLKEIIPTKTPVREQAPEVRARNFGEVSGGYTEMEALREADRCLDCARPRCVEGCPVTIDIPGFLRRMRERDYRGAYAVLSRATLLPAVCGRVCTQETQCEGSCTLGRRMDPVAIGRLERFMGDLAISEGWVDTARRPYNGLRIAVVGSGPAGLACAADMARAGCEVTIFEALHKPGGVLRYGIPEFRLPKAVVDAEIEKLVRLGVRIECDTLVGRLFTIEQMRNEMGFDAVFIGTGAGYPKFLGLPGEGLNGVSSANEFLTRCNLMGAGDFPVKDTPLGMGRRVAVIGGGNTAMDATRVALRLGAEKVYCLYRRGRAESPGRLEEIRHAEEEGVDFRWLTAPVEILDNGAGAVGALRCRRMRLGEPGADGRRRPVPIPESLYELEVDTVIYAIGTNANPIIGQTSGLRLDARGYIETDHALQTSMPGVFAGGDIVTGAATVILAMGAGRRAASAMMARLGIGQVPPEPVAAVPARV